jgi:hypothetical protein
MLVLAVDFYLVLLLVQINGESEQLPQPPVIALSITTPGNLFFDSDGNGAIAPIQLATLIGNPTITQNDILVMA